MKAATRIITIVGVFLQAPLASAERVPLILAWDHVELAGKCWQVSFAGPVYQEAEVWSRAEQRLEDPSGADLAAARADMVNVLISQKRTPECADGRKPLRIAIEAPGSARVPIPLMARASTVENALGVKRNVYDAATKLSRAKAATLFAQDALLFLAFESGPFEQWVVLTSEMSRLWLSLAELKERWRQEAELASKERVKQIAQEQQAKAQAEKAAYAARRAAQQVQVRELTSPDAAVRYASTRALLNAASLHQLASEVLADIIQALAANLCDSNRNVSETAVTTLGLIGPEAAGAIPAIERAAARRCIGDISARSATTKIRGLR